MKRKARTANGNKQTKQTQKKNRNKQATTKQSNNKKKHRNKQHTKTYEKQISGNTHSF